MMMTMMLMVVMMMIINDEDKLYGGESHCNNFQVGHLTTDPGPTVALGPTLAPTTAVNQNINNNNNNITVALLTTTTTTTTTTTSLDLSIWHTQSTINPESISMA